MESSRDSFGHPDLGLALRTLRRRVRLTQKEVAEAASARGARLSTIWYARLEREPDARPSVATLGAILEVLGSTWEELDALLTEGERVDAEGSGATWSAPVELMPPVPSPAPAPSPAQSPLAELVTIWDGLAPEQQKVLLAFARSLA